MFRMLGKKVELYRYKVSWNGGQENCISAEHKNEIEQMLTDKEITFETTLVDQTSNEWFNGLEFGSYDEALEVFNQGQTLYEANEALAKVTSAVQLRADTDYIAVMMGVEL